MASASCLAPRRGHKLCLRLVTTNTGETHADAQGRPFGQSQLNRDAVDVDTDTPAWAINNKHACADLYGARGVHLQ